MALQFRAHAQALSAPARRRGLTYSHTYPGQASALDPLAGVVAPTVGACDFTASRDDRSDSKSPSTLNPGTYCGGISITGHRSVTFSPGTYILLGGGLRIDGGAQVTGAGVTFYNTGDSTHRYQPISIDGQSKATLSAPVSGSLAGVLFFQDRTIAKHGEVDDHDRDGGQAAGGNGQANVISGNSESTFEGALYFPTTQLVYAGGSEEDPAAYTLIVADSIALSGQSNISLTVLGSPMSDVDPDVCSQGKSCNRH